MKEALLQLPKEQLADRVIELEKRVCEVEELRERLAWFERMVFGQKRERFVPENPEQMALALGLLEAQQKAEEVEAEVSYTRRQKQQKEKPVRKALPAHLPRVEEVIEPDCDLSGAVVIGEEVTEILEYKQAKFWVRRIVRKKYAWPREEEKGVVIASLPSRPIDKAIAGASLLAQIIINKFVDHLPLYRQIQRFKRLGIQISMSTMCGWIAQTAKLLLPLYWVLVREMLESGYAQTDETGVRVLDGDKKGATRLGHHWIYQNPERGLVVFEYQPDKSRAGPGKMLKEFKGFLQSDGAPVFDEYGTNRYPGIVAVGCMAHARREFFEARENDAKKAEEALFFIRALYKIEAKAREQGLSPEERHELRQEEAIPILGKFKEWLDEKLLETTPKSLIGKAIAYCLRRWTKLCNYTLNGRLEIDNNLAENSIRPIALGRKNYLFAGSHEAAQHAAVLYSFLASCKRNEIDPHEWMLDVLKRIKEHPVNRLNELLPDNWKQRKA